MLKLLFLVEIEFRSYLRTIRQGMFGECQHAQLHLAQRELFTRTITLTLVGMPVDRPLVEECFVDTSESLAILATTV